MVAHIYLDIPYSNSLAIFDMNRVAKDNGFINMYKINYDTTDAAIAVTDNDGLLSNLATNREKVHVPTTGYTCTAAKQTTTESLFMILRKLLY